MIYSQEQNSELDSERRGIAPFKDGVLREGGPEGVMVVIEPPPHRRELENFGEELFNEGVVDFYLLTSRNFILTSRIRRC